MLHSQPIATIAVLPFVNNSANKELQYFASGLSEDLITDLSKYASLQVISSHSSLRASAQRDTLAKQVDYIVKGSFRQAQQVVKINAQLLAANDERVIWSQRYEEALEDLADYLPIFCLLLGKFL